MSNTALVTGASSGIGREFAKQLAARNIRPVLTSRNLKKLEELRKEIESIYRITAEVIPIDLSVTGSADELIEECEKRNLDIDILINNAGVGMFGMSAEQESPKIESMLTLNVISLTTLSSRFAAKMKEKGGGYILNVGSLAGNQPTPLFSSYAASKGYVHNFSAALRRELKACGVKVTCLVPGYVGTNFDGNAGISNERYLALSRRGGQTPSKVARIGLRAMFRGRGRVTVGLANKLLAFFAGLIPSGVKAAFMHAGIRCIIR